MPKKISYIADAGSAMIGNEDIQFFICNGYGDGSFTLTVLEPDEEKKYLPKDAKWCGVFSGKGLRVYHYDCGPQFGYTEIPDGRYFAYNRNGKIWIVRSRQGLMEMDLQKDRIKKLSWTLAWDMYHLALEHKGYVDLISGLTGDEETCIRSIQSEILNGSEKVESYKKILNSDADESKFTCEAARTFVKRIDDLYEEMKADNG